MKEGRGRVPPPGELAKEGGNDLTKGRRSGISLGCGFASLSLAAPAVPPYLAASPQTN